jgi:flagellar biogenesis protein FliO
LGVFANAIALAVERTPQAARSESRKSAGLAQWLLDRLRRPGKPLSRLTVIERVNLAPHQSLALVEADGQRLLVALSPGGAPTTIHPLRLAAQRRRGVTEIKLEGTIA